MQSLEDESTAADRRDLNEVGNADRKAPAGAEWATFTAEQKRLAIEMSVRNLH